MNATMDIIEIRNVAKHGGSLALNIPTEMAKKMGLTVGCPVIFRFDSKRKQIQIEVISKVETFEGKIIDISEIPSCAGDSSSK